MNFDIDSTTAGHVEIFDGGIEVPMDPMDLLQCDSCQ